MDQHSKHDEEQPEPAFKVVDRRRSNVEAESEPQAKSAAAEPTKAATLPQIDFSIFIQSLAHQALMGMGLVPWPDSGLVEPRLEQARETIDVLALLREKTKGNLTPDEERMFETLLYELRVVFVQAMQGGGKPRV